MSLSPPSSDAAASLTRVTDLVARLISRNRDLTAECDDMYAHIESLTHQLAAREAAYHTLTQEAQAHAAQLAAGADVDHRRLARMRAELQAFLSEIDARLATRPQHG